MRNQIEDRNVREALEVLQSEFKSQEELIDDYGKKIANLEDDLENALNNNEELQNQIETHESKIAELEEALAEAYLTQEVKSGEPEDNSG